jgi:hypothetical protein
MKTTIDIPDTIYRKVKAKSAIEGRAVRDVAITLFSSWLENNDLDSQKSQMESEPAKQPSKPLWFASLRKYAANANGNYDMAAIRRSIAHGRRNKELTR